MYKVARPSSATRTPSGLAVRTLSRPGSAASKATRPTSAASKASLATDNSRPKRRGTSFTPHHHQIGRQCAHQRFVTWSKT